MNKLLLEYFPELKRELKCTHQKQWNKFLIGFGEICLWVHCNRAAHKSGHGIVLFPKFWKQHFSNYQRWHFDLENELLPYLVTDNHYDYKAGISKCWLPTDDFISRSINFVTDYRFKTSPYWQSVIDAIIKPENVDLTISNIKIKSSIFDHVINDNIETGFILSTYKKDLLLGNKLEYYVSSSGRLHHPLQNLKTEVRNQLFVGWYNYDIKSCAPTILSQLFTQLESEVLLPALDTFIPNQTEIRNDIAARTGISIKDVKQALTAMFFGLTIPTKSQSAWDINSTAKEDNYRFSLINSIGPEATKILLADDQFSAIVNETQSIIKRLAFESHKTTEKNDLGWQIKNAAGAIKSLSRWNARKVVAHIYFGYERKIIDVISEVLTELEIKHFLIHDGWISDTPINISQLKKRVFIKTGFEILFTLENL